ncbi:ROK family transcriptional regulator [Kineococcus sp. NPDC059986]|uniref:ROK family transcriptional regulator n=1 Tax=Kineococcus sp. NPDC059986 TaxID=3155538 RepID=UPI00344D0B19
MSGEGGRARLVSSDVREHNRALVLQHLDAAGPTARAELAEVTGLAKSAVTVLVADLVAEGLVRDAAGGPDRSRAGRPTQPLELDGSGWAVVTVQVLLDERRWLVTDLAGRVLGEGAEQARTPPADPEAVAAGVAGLAGRLAADLRRSRTRAVALQVVAPGPVLRGDRTVYRAVDLGWDAPVHLRDLVTAALPARSRLPVAVLNDADCATWAEFSALRAEPGREDLRDLVYVKSDTGIGGGAVVGGRLLTGSHGTAFEPGHLVVRTDGPACACGRRGCLAVLAGPEALLAATGLGSQASRDGLSAATAELLRRHRAGDARVVAAVREAVRWVGVGLDLAVIAVDPAVVVLDGGVLLAVLEESGGAFAALGPGLDVEVRTAARPGTAALHGASSLARSRLLASSGTLTKST